MNIQTRSVVKLLTIIFAYAVLIMVAFMARQELIWIGTAFFLAVAINPAVVYLSRVMPKKSRGLAAGSVFLLLVLLFGFLLTSLLPPLIAQSEQFVHNFPRYSDQLINGHSLLSDKIRQYNLVDRIRQSQSQLLSYATSISGSFLTIAKGLFSSFAAGITVLGLTFFMLLEGPNWIEAFWTLVPAGKRGGSRLLAAQMYDAVTGYVTGNVLTSVLAAVITAAMLAILHVHYAITLGILLGLFDFLPLVGATIGSIIVVLAALFASVPAAIVMTIFFIIYQQIENHFLQPLVYGRTVQMSPLLVLVCVLIGAGVGGIIGAIVAIPVGASLRIIFKEVTLRRQARKEA